MAKPHSGVSKRALNDARLKQPKPVRASVKTKTKTKAAAVPAAKPKQPVAPIPSAWRIAKAVLGLLWDNKRLFMGLTAIYGLLNLILVHGFSGNTDVSTLKNNLSSAFSGHFASLASGAAIFAVLIGSAGNGSSATAGPYQGMLAILACLAFVWTLRQRMADEPVRIRDAYYRGMYPLIPFMLVLLIVTLQLLPLIIGGSLYGIVIANGIAVRAYEQILWAVPCLGLAYLSLYWLSSSVFGLFIVTLPDMTPLKALRSARDLVKSRRLAVFRKIIFLPFVLLVIAAVIMLPIIGLVPVIAAWLFFILSIFALLATNAYMFGLYRELLSD